MALKILALCFASFLFISGCATVNNPPSLVVIGNSITHYGPNPSIGWTGDWGAAVPAEAQDFSHIVAADLHIPVSVNNLGIETEPQRVDQIPVLVRQVNVASIVVLELGDNAEFGGQIPGFATAYSDLAAAMSHGHALVCVSTFWHYPDIDEIIKPACEANGGRYAFIGDIFTEPANPDRQSTLYWYWGLAIHPQVWGHQQIAERVLAQIR